MNSKACCASVGAAQVEGRVPMLDETENLNNEMIGMIEDLGIQFSNLTTAEEVGICDIEEQLLGLEKNILQLDKLAIREQDATQTSEYMGFVREVCELSQVLGLLYLSNQDEKHNELLKLSQSILQMAMEKFENEFIQLLAQCCLPIEPKGLSFYLTEVECTDHLSSGSFDEELVESITHGDTIREPENVFVNSIHHELVSRIIPIANLMFTSNYDQECYHAYLKVRKDALEKCLSVLQIDNFFIADVLRMDWEILSRMMRKWNYVMHAFVRFCLAREKHLFDLVFGNHSKELTESCLVEISKSSMLQLLGIAMGIAITPPMVEKLFQIIDTYETLIDLLVDMEHFFHSDYGSSILAECHQVLLRLKESVMMTIEEFKFKIQTNRASAFAGGGVHPLTRYVMNYIKTLVTYSKTLNLILEDKCGVDYSSSLEDGVGEMLSVSPMARHLKSVATILEANLESKSQLYNDTSLQSIFLMNNIFYIVNKVQNSDLRNFFGDKWLRAHTGKFKMYSLYYQRASWYSVLSFLKEEGIHEPGSVSPSLTVIKGRFRSFNRAFEQLYKTQTAWLVPNDRLRDDLRIAISAKLILAYRTFAGKYTTYLDGEKHQERYIKYTPDELGGYLEDLFEGSPKSLHHYLKR